VFLPIGLLIPAPRGSGPVSKKMHNSYIGGKWTFFCYCIDKSPMGSFTNRMVQKAVTFHALQLPELELELIQTQMAQKPMLRAEVGMRVRCANKASAE